jgi:hypothetical protein
VRDDNRLFPEARLGAYFGAVHAPSVVDLELKAIHSTTPVPGVLRNKVVGRWTNDQLEVGRIDETRWAGAAPLCSVEWIEVIDNCIQTKFVAPSHTRYTNTKKASGCALLHPLVDGGQRRVTLSAGLRHAMRLAGKHCAAVFDVTAEVNSFSGELTTLNRPARATHRRWFHEGSCSTSL